LLSVLDLPSPNLMMDEAIAINSDAPAWSDAEIEDCAGPRRLTWRRRRAIGEIAISDDAAGGIVMNVSLRRRGAASNF
jgi:hypothetical protein